MKRQIPDEQLDRMMRTLICDASADEEELKDVADSPTLWWAVQREINAQKETAKSPWPPANVIRRWLLVAIPTAAAAAVVVSLFIMRPVTGPEIAAEQKEAPAAVSPAATAPVEPISDPVSRSLPANAPVKVSATAKPAKTMMKSLPAVHRDRTRLPDTLTASAEKKEIKTAFIALTYAREPESGQIVRVKVPSSMMVSLGLVASVEKPASLVDAEVLVGDDGLTRAIRFIH